MIKKCRFLLLCILSCVFASVVDCGAAVTGKKQNAIDLGTKVTSATELKYSSCSEKYFACMDSGCMIDNAPGGRCQCNNKFKELNAQFDKIRQRDYTAKQVAKFSREIIEKENMDGQIIIPASDDDMYGEYSAQNLSPTGEYGESLRVTMHDLCMEKMPECKSELTLMKSLYSQKIKSDCVAFENALNVQTMKSKDLRAGAKKAVREAALEQYQESNKYDLGQCVVEFERCMQTTAECGQDWSGCVGTLGIDKMYADPASRVAVIGPNSSVMIAASTMEILEHRKLACESITKQCVSVKDQVWDTFLKNAVLSIKSAELTAESNTRTSCLNKISDCFLNACKDNINENKPDSYDFCLTHPESMKKFCKVEMEPCLAATGGSYDKPEESTLWPSVLAKLSAMQVDACTAEVKECIQSADRCGKDYSKCIGLDTNIIVRMCPYEKLPACQNMYGKEKIKTDDTEIYNAIASVIEGVILNIDNNMLKTCQNKISDAMTKICGDAESCAEYAVNNDTIGTQSLRYQICEVSADGATSARDIKWFGCRTNTNQISDWELGRVRNSLKGELGEVKLFAGVISGVISWESVQINDEGYIDIDGYIAELKKAGAQTEEIERIRSELLVIQTNINQTINLIERDEWVSYCISGREVPGVTDILKGNKARFPKLSNTIRRQIAASALQRAKENFYRVYEQYSERLAEDNIKIRTRIAKNLDENIREAAAQAARESCVGMAAISAFAKAPVGEELAGKAFAWIGIIVAIVVCIILCIFLPPAGAAAGTALGKALAGMVAAVTGTTVGSTTAATAATTAAVTAALTATAITGTTIARSVGDTQDKEWATRDLDDRELEAQAHTNVVLNHGEFFANEWNYQSLITSDFDVDTMTCKRCTKSRRCKKTKWSMATSRFCAKWGEWEEPLCNDLKF